MEIKDHIQLLIIHKINNTYLSGMIITLFLIDSQPILIQHINTLITLIFFPFLFKFKIIFEYEYDTEGQIFLVIHKTFSTSLHIPISQTKNGKENEILVRSYLYYCLHHTPHKDKESAVLETSCLYYVTLISCSLILMERLVILIFSPFFPENNASNC